MPVNALCEVYIFFRFCGLVLFCLSLPLTVIANPQGADVVHGQVDFDRPNAHTLNITNSPSAIVNWQSFSIDKGERTHFIQQTATSAILNRVTGQDPSAILGNLSSNGRVFLINPNGMVFGPDAVIDTAGFIGSTLNLTDDDFLAGKLNFEGGSEAGRIENHGLIQAKDDGGIYLIAPSIENSGLIHTDGGSLLLAAGRKITISSLDLDHISVEIQAPEDEVLNLGTMLSSGGAMGFFAGTIRNHGHVEANSMTVDEAGTIKLVAKADIHLEADSQIQASGSQGGDIHIESKTGTTWVAGDVEATGSDNTGGQINILGERVGVIGDANIDASGETGGGSVLVGGDYKGEGDVKNAQVTYVGKGATITADAVTEGDGGKVIVWADDTTRYYGNTSVRGGGDSGNGGFVEVSGKKNLDFHGLVDTTAVNGELGTLLLDPLNIEIVSSSGAADDDQIEDNQILAGDEPAATFTISEEALESLRGEANIILEATNNITINNLSDDELIFQEGTESVTFRADADSDGAGNFLMNENDVITTSGASIEIRGSNITAGTINTTSPVFSQNSGGGDIDIMATNDISANEIEASSNNFEIGSAGSITVESVLGNITLGNVNSSAPPGSLVGWGEIVINAGGRIEVNGSEEFKGDNLSLVAGGAVTITNSSFEGETIGIESTGSRITLTSVVNIKTTRTSGLVVGVGEPESIILKAADDIFMSANSSIESEDGNITLTSTAGEISLGTVSSPGDGGQITITAGGGGIDETGNDTDANVSTGGTAVLTANGAIGDTAANGELDTDVATLRIPSANGPVNIVENDNIQLGDGTGGISSNGAIAIESTGGQIDLRNTINTTGDGGITLETNLANTDSNDIILRDNGINASNGAVMITAGGDILDGDGNDDEPEIITTSRVTLTANGGQGAIGAENAVINIFGTNDVNTNGNPIFVSTEVPSAPPEEPLPGELVSEKEGGLRAFTPERPSDVSGLKEAKPWTDNIDEKTASTQWLETGPRIDFETMSSDFSVNALLNDEWILLVDYKLEKPGDVNLTISGEGVSPTKIKLDGSTTKRQVAVVVLSMLHDRLSSNTRHTIMGDFWANLNLTAVEVNNPKVPVQMNLYNLSAGPKDNLLPPLSDTRTLPTPGAPKLHPIEADVDPRPPSMVDEPGTPTASKMPDEPGDDKRVKLTCYGPCGEIEDRLAARSSRNLDEIKFGPPSLIRPTAGEQARYSFYSRSDFDIVDVYFLRVKQEAPGIETELTVNSQRLPAGIAKGEWVGKDEQRSWNGMMSKNEPSLGQHGLRVKAYDQTEGWHVGNADSRVTVVE